MKELFRFVTIRKFDPQAKLPGNIDIKNVTGKYYARAQKAADQKELDAVVAAFDKEAKIKDPMMIDKSLAAIYLKASAEASLSAGQLEEWCKTATKEGIRELVAAKTFATAKGQLIEQLYFLELEGKSAAPQKTTYKKMLRLVGLLEAVARKDQHLDRLLANPSLQYYLFEFPDFTKATPVAETPVKPLIDKDMKSFQDEIKSLESLDHAKTELLQRYDQSKKGLLRYKNPVSDDKNPTENSKEKTAATTKTTASVNPENQALPGLATLVKGLSAVTIKSLERFGLGEMVDPLEAINFIEQKVNEKQHQIQLKTKAMKAGGRGNALGAALDGIIDQIDLPSLRTLLDFSSLVIPEILPPVPTSLGTARVLGEGMLLMVEESYQGAELGNLGGVVNIPPNSKKELIQRNLTKSLNISQTETELSQSEEESSEQRQQHNMASETGKIQKADVELKAGLSISASYGPTLGMEISSNLTSSLSSTETSKSASSYARDVTSRAVKKIDEKTKGLWRSEVTRENETTQTESFDNPNASPSIGIYQWVNERYQASLVHYDSRLQLEFMVPMPGRILLYAMNAPVPSVDLPTAPAPFDLTVDQIQPGNYKAKVAKWGAVDVIPPPPYSIAVTKAYEFLNAPEHNKMVDFVAKDDSLSIPEGYKVDFLHATMSASKPQPLNAFMVSLIIAHRAFSFNDLTRDFRTSASDRQFHYFLDNMANYRNIPITVTGYQDRCFTLNVVVYCIRDSTALDKWQLDTYTKLKKAYQQLADEYNDKLAVARQRRLFSGTATGNSPEKNRQIEKDELKRSCISILTSQSFELFNGIVEPSSASLPTIDFREAISEGNYIRFFEHAFEWTQLSSVLYPYFWSNPTQNWIRSLTLSTEDPKYTDFLKAGYARVVIPVRPEFNSAILKYLEDGTLWDGADPDTIDLRHPAYVKIAAELMERQGKLAQQPTLIDQWEYTLPTDYKVLSNGMATPMPKPFI